MNRYVLIPEDTLRILPPEDGAGAAIEIFCSRTVIYFEIAQLREVCLLHHVRADRELVDALCFTAADRLLEQPQKVLIPTNRPGLRGLPRRSPALCAANARFFQRGGRYRAELRPQRASFRIKAAKAAHPERKQEVQHEKTEKRPRGRGAEDHGHAASFTDPQGSWTGLPADEHEPPVQDADDL